MGVHRGAKHIHSCVSSCEQDVRIDHGQRIHYDLVSNDGDTFMKSGDKLIFGRAVSWLVEYNAGMTLIGVTLA